MEEDLVDIIWGQQQKGMQNSVQVSPFTNILRETDTIVTFDYDTLVEESLSQAEHPWNYGFDVEKGQGIKVLKMHGSINWAIKELKRT